MSVKNVGKLSIVSQPLLCIRKLIGPIQVRSLMSVKNVGKVFPPSQSSLHIIELIQVRSPISVKNVVNQP
ncbi:hypothetical protein LEMLEM_LOCUS20807 [Lemmus lemmus]